MIQENPTYFKPQPTVVKNVFEHWDLLVSLLLWVVALIVLIIVINFFRNYFFSRKIK